MTLDLLWVAPLAAVCAVALLTIGVVIGWLANDNATRLHAEALARRISDEEAIDTLRRYGR